LKRRSIHYVNDSDTVKVAYKKLSKHNILSVPVKNSSGKFTRFLDVLDLVEFVVQGGDDSTLVSSVSGLSGRNPYVEIGIDDNLLEVVKSMCMTHTSLHRLAVTSGDELVGILSQSLVVRFLYGHIADFDFGNSSVGQLNLGIRSVVTVTEGSSIADALNMIRKHEVSGVGIVDDNGLLVGSFSSSSIKNLGLKASITDLSSTNLSNYTFAKTNRHNLVVTKKTMVREVAKMMAVQGVHRLFVVDDEGKCIGVISLVDIIGLFFRHLVIG